MSDKENPIDDADPIDNDPMGDDGPQKKYPRLFSLVILLGMGAGLGTGGLFLLLVLAIQEITKKPVSGYWEWSVFTVVPFGIGFVSSQVWQRMGLSRNAIYDYSWLTLIIGIGLGALLYHEGILCLILAFPLMMAFVSGGIATGISLAERRDGRLRVAVLPLLTFLVIGESLSPHHYANAVTDTVVIHAPAAKVWSYLAGYPAITDKPDYWLWRIGLPYPVQSVADGASVGAARECRFTDGVTVGERITEVVPDRRLAFGITRQPNNPEIMGHFVLKRGEFDLTDNKNGTCTLSGTSWYALNVYPSWYYDLWTVDIVRHVHLRVMWHIKTLAETN